jgi:aromatic-amino-acid transaminase
MFQSLPEAKPDAILKLLALFREDQRENKLDLGVGVYKDENGATPVMKAIKAAEKQLLESQDTKSYVGPIGSRPFCSAMVAQVFGEDADADRIRCAQSAGGSGALRILSDLLRKIRPNAKVWVSDPTWPNHVPLLTAAGFELEQYPYYDRSTNSITFDQMMSVLNAAPENDIVLLHGCCHNPTGADLNKDQWKAIADVCEQRSLFPFLDFAYQGFGDGLEEDAEAIRYLAGRMPEMVVAASCSKNLGLYRERAGAAMVLAETAEHADRALGMLGGVIRSNYSMPPDHGANVSNIVLSDPTLNAQWKDELNAMRTRMVGLRVEFAAAMRKRSNSEDYDFIAEQKGMFSRLPLTTEQIDTLRSEHGIYIVGDGRINIAGLPGDALDELAETIVSVL